MNGEGKKKNIKRQEKQTGKSKQKHENKSESILTQ